MSIWKGPTWEDVEQQIAKNEKAIKAKSEETGAKGHQQAKRTRVGAPMPNHPEDTADGDKPRMKELTPTDVESIIRATVAGSAAPAGLDSNALLAAISKAGKRFSRWRVPFHSMPTEVEMETWALDIKSSAKSLQRSFQAVREQPLVRMRLAAAAAEWATGWEVRERRAFEARKLAAAAAASAECESDVAEKAEDQAGEEQELDDLFAAFVPEDFVSAACELVDRLGEIAVIFAKHQKRDSVTGLPRKGGRASFDAALGAKGPSGKPLSPQEQLIGRDLPDAYEQAFGAVYATGSGKDGAGAGGPGIRFVIASLAALGVTKRDGGAFTPLTIREYRKHATRKQVS